MRYHKMLSARIQQQWIIMDFHWNTICMASSDGNDIHYISIALQSDMEVDHPSVYAKSANEIHVRFCWFVQLINDTKKQKPINLHSVRRIPVDNSADNSREYTHPQTTIFILQSVEWLFNRLQRKAEFFTNTKYNDSNIFQRRLFTIIIFFSLLFISIHFNLVKCLQFGNNFRFINIFSQWNWIYWLFPHFFFIFY